MEFNFFDWIRNGVKRSVLMGVNDAVEHLGMPAEEDASKDKILSFLQSDEQKKLASPTASRARRTNALGRGISKIAQE